MDIDVADLATFSRAFAVQGRSLAWLLGAGTSAAAGVPTAAQIIDDLQLRLYADAHGLVRQHLDPADPLLRRQLDAYFDNANGFPSLSDPAMYGAVFSAAMPDADVRQRYLHSLMEGRRPSFGQRVLGALIAAGLIDLVVTTNFDDLVEQGEDSARVRLVDNGAAARNRLVVAALGSPDRAAHALASDDWPLLIKVHGDFREVPLKNLASELQEQDATLRQAVTDAARRFGLVVVGYSGRDASLMAALKDALSTPNAWPGGIWWLTRSPEAISEPVRELLDEAASRGVTTRLVQSENFDETMTAVGRQATLPSPLRAYVDGETRPRVTEVALPTVEGARFPALRLNALPILEGPTHALETTLSGDLPRPLHEVVRETRWRGAAVASGRRLLVLGDLAALLPALGVAAEPARRIEIAPTVEFAPTIELALTYEAVTTAIARRTPLRARLGRRHVLIVRSPATDPAAPDRKPEPDTRLAPLRAAYGDALTGLLPDKLGTMPDGTRRRWAEGVRVGLEWRLGRLWLLFDPFTWVQRVPAAEGVPRVTRRGVPTDPAAAWVKERWIFRRNEKWADIIGAWASLLAPDETTELLLVAPSAGDEAAPTFLNARFRIGSTTAYARPGGGR